eukprot:scaffold33624_cov63-Phaeocystis_antarctica.AAC.1
MIDDICLQDERVDVVEVRRKALAVRRGEVGVAPAAAAEVLLEQRDHAPHAVRVALRPREAYRAALLEAGPDLGRRRHALAVVRLPLAIGVAGDVDVLGVIELARPQQRIDLLPPQPATVVLRLVGPPHVEGAALVHVVEEVLRRHRCDEPAEEALRLVRRVG